MKIYLCDLTYTQQILNSDVMPAQIGSIAAFTEKYVPEVGNIDLFKYPEALAKALDEEIPDLIGFSHYVWNSRLSYRFAETIKKYSPSTIVVFGGPHYPMDFAKRVEFLRDRPAIDFYIVKEGEAAFAELAKALIYEGVDTVKQRLIPSVHYLRSDGAAVFAVEKERIKDLSEIPSPYLTGKMDPFFDGKLIPILQTNRGCPFQCTFCVEGLSYYTKIYRSPAEKVEKEIEYIASRVVDSGSRRDLYVADSNFGMYAADLQTCEALAGSMAQYGWPSYINCTTGKNAKERVLDAAKLLKGALRLSGSVQSLEPAVLANVKRSNIREEEILELALKSAEVGANSYSEIILGLPGDTLAGHERSLQQIVDSGFTNVYTWQLMLLPGSELETKESREKFQFKTQFRVLPRCFGKFNILGNEVASAEIEEIATGNPGLDFNDYHQIRKLHLCISIFYNDGLMAPFIKLLRHLGLSPFDWLKRLASAPLPSESWDVLSTFFHDFGNDTEVELWNDREHLREFAETHMDAYLSGERGNNLLFTYRTHALVKYLPYLLDFATDVLEDMVPPKYWGYLLAAKRFIACRAHGIFDEQKTITVTLPWNVEALTEQTTRYRFVPSPDVDEQLKLYGHTQVGIARILMKAYASRLYRKPQEIPLRDEFVDVIDEQKRLGALEMDIEQLEPKLAPQSDAGFLD